MQITETFLFFLSLAADFLGFELEILGTFLLLLAFILLAPLDLLDLFGNLRLVHDHCLDRLDRAPRRRRRRSPVEAHDENTEQHQVDDDRQARRGKVIDETPQIHRRLSFSGGFVIRPTLGAPAFCSSVMT